MPKIARNVQIVGNFFEVISRPSNLQQLSKNVRVAALHLHKSSPHFFADAKEASHAPAFSAVQVAASPPLSRCCRNLRKRRLGNYVNKFNKVTFLRFLLFLHPPAAIRKEEPGSITHDFFELNIYIVRKHTMRSPDQGRS